MVTIRLCWQLVLASIRGQMQYRLNFVIGVLSGMFFQSINLVFIWAILETFPSLGGWNFREIALLYGIRLTAHGLYLVFFSEMFAIDNMVREGGYDRLLIRPIHPMLQLMFGQFRITVLGDLFGGMAILTAAFMSLGVEWTPELALLLIFAIAGGAMIDGAFQILPASLSFRYLDTWPARVVFDDIFSRYGNYPVNIFGAITERVLTFVIPMAFVAWLPAATLLNKPTFLPLWTGWLGLPIGAVLFWVAITTFMSASRSYQSSGS